MFTYMLCICCVYKCICGQTVVVATNTFVCGRFRSWMLFSSHSNRHIQITAVRNSLNAVPILHSGNVRKHDFIYSTFTPLHYVCRASPLQDSNTAHVSKPVYNYMDLKCTPNFWNFENILNCLLFGYSPFQWPGFPYDTK